MTSRAWVLVGTGILLPLLVLVGVTVWWLHHAQAPTAEELEGRVAGRSGVVDVVVTEVEGDDAMPFEEIPYEVTVAMAAGSTVEQVESALHAFDDDIRRRHVDFVDLGLRGSHATLTIGVGGEVRDGAVDELLAAAGDPRVRSYHRVDTPLQLEVEVELRRVRLSTVVAYADRFARVGPVEDVSVVSGRFAVLRDGHSPSLQDRRERIAVRLDRRYDLVAADIGSSGPLVLSLASPVERRAVQAYLAALPRSAGGGDVRVAAPPPSARSTTSRAVRERGVPDRRGPSCRGAAGEPRCSAPRRTPTPGVAP